MHKILFKRNYDRPPAFRIDIALYHGRKLRKEVKGLVKYPWNSLSTEILNIAAHAEGVMNDGMQYRNYG